MDDCIGRALREVQRYHPGVTTVVVSAGGVARYSNDQNEAVDMDRRVRRELLDAAVDSARGAGLPVVHRLEPFPSAPYVGWASIAVTKRFRVEGRSVAEASENLLAVAREGAPAGAVVTLVSIEQEAREG